MKNCDSGVEEAIIGTILGTAVGDALGLPFEGLPPERLIRLAPDLNRYHFIVGKGMVSDDTEHASAVAEALMESPRDIRRFEKSLAHNLRMWLLGLPGGIGLATLKATLKLWLGFPPGRSGVFSAGNGPAMRSAVIGVCFRDNLEALAECARISTRITHTDPRAEHGAMAVALAASLAGRDADIHPAAYQRSLAELLGPRAGAFLELIEKAGKAALAGKTTGTFARELGLKRGISGYVYHTVPAVIHCWLRNQQDFRSGLKEITGCGGDTDTTAAILGGIIGARVRKKGIPEEWLKGLWEWPRTVNWMEGLGRNLASALVQGLPQKHRPLPYFAILPRNLFFVSIVLLHGFRSICGGAPLRRRFSNVSGQARWAKPHHSPWERRDPRGFLKP